MASRARQLDGTSAAGLRTSKDVLENMPEADVVENIAFYKSTSVFAEGRMKLQINIKWSA